MPETDSVLSSLIRRQTWRGYVRDLDDQQRILVADALTCIARSKDVLMRCQPTQRFTSPEAGDKGK
jgi:hypothetical protein